MRFLFTICLSLLLTNCVIEDENTNKSNKGRRGFTDNAKGGKRSVDRDIDIFFVSINDKDEDDDTTKDNTPAEDDNLKENESKNTLNDLEPFTFPITALQEGTVIGFHANKERTQIDITTNNPLKIIAGSNGTILLKDNKIILKRSDDSNLILAYSDKAVNLSVTDNQSVKKGETLGEATKNLIFSIEQDNSAIALCLNIKDTDGLVTTKYTKEENPNDPCL